MPTLAQWINTWVSIDMEVEYKKRNPIFYKQPCIILFLLYKHRRPWIENGEHFAIHSWTWQSGMKAWVMSQQLIGNIKQTRKIIVCSNSFPQGWKSLLNVTVGMINIIIWQLLKVHQKITSKSLFVRSQ